jgi:hypothetical protein
MFILNFSSKYVLCNAKKIVFDLAVVIIGIVNCEALGKTRLRFPVCFIKHLTMKMWESDGSHIVTLAPVISCMPCCFTPRERISVCPRSSQGVVKKKKSSTPAGKQTTIP